MNVYGRFSKPQFELNQQLECFEAIEEQMQVKQVWDVECIRDRCFEDNDTDSDEEDIKMIEKALKEAK